MGDLRQSEAILDVSKNNSVVFSRNHVGPGVRAPHLRSPIQGFSVGEGCPPGLSKS